MMKSKEVVISKVTIVVKSGVGEQRELFDQEEIYGRFLECFLVYLT